MLKFFTIVLLYFVIITVHSKDDVKKIKESLSQGGKIKEQTVRIVDERGRIPKPDASNKNSDKSKDKKSIKTNQKPIGTGKVTTEKHVDQTKKAEKESKKKVTNSPPDTKDKDSRATKTTTKKTEKTDKPLNQYNKVTVVEGGDIAETIKSTAQEPETQVEQASDGFFNRVFHMFSDVKSSLLDLEPTSSTTDVDADVTDQAPPKANEIPNSLRKMDPKIKKKGKAATDL